MRKVSEAIVSIRLLRRLPKQRIQKTSLVTGQEITMNCVGCFYFIQEEKENFCDRGFDVRQPVCRYFIHENIFDEKSEAVA